MDLASTSAINKTLSCEVCKKTFTQNYNLRKHLKKYHPLLNTNDVAPKLPRIKKSLCEKTYQFTCTTCNKNFNHLKNLKLHTKIHSDETVDTVKEKGKKCPMCGFRSPYKKTLYDHFESAHNITIQTQTLKFDSKEEYLNWLNTTEKQTKTKFIKECGSVLNGHNSVTNYICHRSGVYEPKGKGIRHLKTQGSNKIGFCPAGFKVSIDNEDMKHTIVYVNTHVGHECDLGHLMLTLNERHNLASKIAAKMPFDAILDEIRDSISDSSLDRIHLLTKKDLYNIESAFNLNSASVRHQSDAVSIESWVREMDKSGSILLYKSQDTYLERYPELKYEDFILVIMNQGQKEILKKYGSDCICIDSTHGINSYGFELTTLLVLDDLRQGFPCCFLISNRGDHDVISIFLSAIREQVGVLKPKVFMSDMANVFYNSWLEVMSAAQFRLFCTWHVDRAWRKNLKRISSKEKQVEVYKILRTLLHETDPSAFSTMVTAFVAQISAHSETIDFASYFRTYYLDKVENWAYCFRLYSGLNTNMHIERMHRTIKYLYLHGKHVKRLDKAVHALMKFVRDKFLDRLIVIHKGKISSKLADIRSRHKTSLGLLTTSVIANDDCWEISSSSNSGETYIIRENSASCTCQLICTDCGSTCLHRYSCSCIDSAIKWNMCKHIHLLCTYKSENQGENTNDLTEDDENALHIHCPNENVVEELEAVVQELSRNKSDTKEDNLMRRIEKFRSKFNTLLDTITTAEQMDVIEKLTAPIVPTLTALNVNPVQFDASTSLPHNKKIVSQKRFFSTKKTKSKQKSNMIPNPEESQNIAVKLILSEKK